MLMKEKRNSNEEYLGLQIKEYSFSFLAEHSRVAVKIDYNLA